MKCSFINVIKQFWFDDDITSKKWIEGNLVKFDQFTCNLYGSAIFMEMKIDMTIFIEH